MEIIRKVYKQAGFLLIPAALFSALIEWKRLPASILVGGVLALANLKGLAWGVEGLIGAGQQASGKLIFFSLIRFFMVFAILLILIWFQLVNIAGIFIGFTLVVVLLLKEGIRLAKNEG